MRPQFHIFLGTMAEFIKILPVIRSFEARSIPYKLILSGQNPVKAQEIWRFIEKKNADIILSEGPKKQTAWSLIQWFLGTLTSHLFGQGRIKLGIEKNDYILIHGDTISTLMGAILGKICGAKICHIEAGLRSFHYFRPFPEEISRILVSRISEYSYCPNSWSSENLTGRKTNKINTKANTLMDSLQMVLNDSQKFETPNLPDDYFVFVCHRQENLMDKAFLEKLMHQIIEKSKNIHCLFVLHAPTKMALKDINLLDTVESLSTITTVPRLSYPSFVHTLKESRFIITDGGSNQEESYYLGKPCLVLRSETERIEGLDHNVVLSRRCPQTIESFFKNPYLWQKDPQEFSVSPSEIILDSLEKIASSAPQKKFKKELQLKTSA
ncbi:MAG: UDP-N-acetylglucosamine 2-epimerase [Oligoflexales bacterium]